MANQNRPFGLLPKRLKSGGVYNGQISRYRKEASVILAIGDPVLQTGTGTASGKRQLVTRASAGGLTNGPMVGRIVSDPDGLAKTYFAAADSGDLLVADDPDLIFIIQEDSDGGSIAITEIGEFCDMVIANANTVLGRSQVMLNSSDAGTGDQLRLLQVHEREDNALGDYCVWDVLINEHVHRAAQTEV